LPVLVPWVVNGESTNPSKTSKVPGDSAF